MVQGGVSYGYQPSHVYTTRPFPFELGFLITIHKAMGKTIDKVIWHYLIVQVDLLRQIIMDFMLP